MFKKSRRLRPKTSKRAHPPSILQRKRKAEVECAQDASDSSASSFERFTNSSEPGNEIVSSQLCPVKVTPSLSRRSTLPDFPWAMSNDVWESLVAKDENYIRDHQLFSRHPELQPRMRAILLDWLIEVCEVYKLHRETFYLAQDCIDRYLSENKNLPKEQLQLLGIASLFIAAKVEEIYPPKLSEFAFVTDGACTEEEILSKEVIILMTLEWCMSPVTVNYWLSVFLQVAAIEETSSDNFEQRRFSGHVFEQICQLLDLCMLDVSCLQFAYSVLAASGVAHFVSKEVALAVSGFKWTDIADCIQWMAPVAKVLDENGVNEPKFFQNIAACDMYSIQTHNIGLKLLEQVHVRRAQQSESSPNSDQMLGILTPPQSIKKICLKRVIMKSDISA